MIEQTEYKRNTEFKTYYERHIDREYWLGDVVVVDFSKYEQNKLRGIRPAIVISNGRNNNLGNTINVVTVTRAENKENVLSEGRYRLLPYQFVLNNEVEDLSFLKYKSIVNCSDIVTVSKYDVDGIVGSLPKAYKVRIVKYLYDLFSMNMVEGLRELEEDEDKRLERKFKEMESKVCEWYVENNLVDTMNPKHHCYSLFADCGQLAISLIDENVELMEKHLGSLLFNLTGLYLQTGNDVEFKVSDVLSYDLSDIVYQKHYTMHKINLDVNHLLYLLAKNKGKNRHFLDTLESLMGQLQLLCDKYNIRMAECYEKAYLNITGAEV